MKRIEKVDDIINGFGEKNISYCVCGSLKDFENCCKKGFSSENWFSDARFCTTINSQLTDLESEYLSDSVSDEDVQKKANDVITIIYRGLDELGIFDRCINPYCTNSPIHSHLFTNKYIKTLLDEGYTFSLDGYKGELGATSYKMNLRCSKCDGKVFKPTDDIVDPFLIFDTKLHQGFSIEEMREMKNLMSEYYLKVFSFRYKTVIINYMRFFYQGLMLVDFSVNMQKDGFIQSLYGEYKNYIATINEFHRLFTLNPKGDISSVMKPNLLGKSWYVDGLEPTNVINLYTNVLIKDNIPVFFMSLLKDGRRIFYVGIDVYKSMTSKEKADEILDEIFTSVRSFQLKNDFRGARDWLESHFFDDNPIYFIKPTIGVHSSHYIYGEKN